MIDLNDADPQPPEDDDTGFLRNRTLSAKLKEEVAKLLAPEQVAKAEAQAAAWRPTGM